ncbi:sugar ABC transporter permease [Longispora fulva]|uniref:Multiple sugar transport system permease protein n=1 Tax=Longispora fulva TaxID=619741 RepID=A0A8J7GIT8_9ACTN|nr:sugar ABC transporter permease [Longispora fulva]MBG6138295.1 multiple sugar transport system permease protein [Longispora fulva]GIG60546.1 sugar ABC transporter permease [Longispora fulva]
MAQPSLEARSPVGSAPSSPAAPSRRRRSARKRRFTRRDLAVFALLVGIPVLLEVALIWGPTIASVALSFSRWDGISPLRWIGGENYTQIVRDYPPFWPAVWHNVLWLGFLGFIATPLGLFFAVLLDKGIRFTRLYQSALYLPVVLSLAVVGFIAQLIYSRDGVLNAIGGTKIDWIGDPHINLWAVLALVAWKHTGYVMILYLAGLKAVDPTLKEAASIDGANEAQTFVKVVFPAMRPINVIVLVITVIEALRAFDIVYVVNKGRNGLELLSVLVSANIVGEASRIGFGSALAVILLTISLGFVVIYLVQVFREDAQ